VLGAPDGRSVARQRWRLRYERDASAADLAQREEADTWASAIDRSGLPVVTAGQPPRPKLAFGPPIPARALARDEPLELQLTDRLTTTDVRNGLEPAAPAGHRIVMVHDVWLGAPALQASGRAVDYEIALASAPAEPLSRAADALLAETELPRERVRATRVVRYDLRPAIEAILVDRGTAGTGDAGLTRLRCRLRIDPERGVARPDELLAALGERLETRPEPLEIIRHRVWLVDDGEIPPLG
jgi:radical SAM-linked protein